MKTIISIALFGFLYLLPSTAQQNDYAKLKSDAEQFYASGSYARANDVDSKLDQSGLSPAEARWVDFRIADTSWRAQAATEISDTTRFDQAQKQLEELRDRGRLARIRSGYKPDSQSVPG